MNHSTKHYPYYLRLHCWSPIRETGIRGQIKKAAVNGGGKFRATFEDKILMSDIVFCRTWTNVEPKEYYNPVSSLLVGDKLR